MLVSSLIFLLEGISCLSFKSSSLVISSLEILFSSSFVSFWLEIISSCSLAVTNSFSCFCCVLSMFSICSSKISISLESSSANADGHIEDSIHRVNNKHIDFLFFFTFTSHSLSFSQCSKHFFVCNCCCKFSPPFFLFFLFSKNL